MTVTQTTVADTADGYSTRTLHAIHPPDERPSEYPDRRHVEPEPRLVDAAARRPVDRAAAITAAADLLKALGRDPSGPHLRDTPRRVVDAYLEMLTPQPFTLTTFPNDEGYDELVLVRDIPVHSLCEHHMLPFDGVAQVAYLPGDRIVGLSKLARVVEHFARDLQVQERLTRQIAEYLQDQLNPRGVAVVIEAEHSCMSRRGVRVSNTRTVTSTLLGEFRTESPVRGEFMALIGR